MNRNLEIVVEIHLDHVSLKKNRIEICQFVVATMVLSDTHASYNHSFFTRRINVFEAVSSDIYWQLKFLNVLGNVLRMYNMII